MKTKTFDCIEMKRRGAAIVQARISRMTPEEELQFWQEQTDRLRERQQAKGAFQAGSQEGKSG
jgi:hypothetical protein